MPKMTKHGKRRIAERNGVQANNAKKIVKRAYRHGIKHYEATNELKKMMDKAFLSHKNATKITFYGNSLYLFHNDIFVTTFNVGQNIMDDLENNIKPDAYEKYRDYKRTIKENKIKKYFR